MCHVFNVIARSSVTTSTWLRWNAAFWVRSPTGPRVDASCADHPNEARAEATRLRAADAPGVAEQVVIAFAPYAAAAADRQTLATATTHATTTGTTS